MSLTVLGGRVRAAARQIAATSSAGRDDVLRAAADLLVAETGAILAANRDDLAAATGLAETAIDRLTLTEDRVRAMADGLRTVAALPDPVGEVVDGWVRPNGLRVERVRVPLGVVGVIYENRPNVTSDVAGLCLKSGNAAFLRGSASALASNAAIVDVLRRALDKAGLPADAVALVTDGSHETAVEFMRLRGVIDCLVPRGGPALIASLLEHATVPYVLDGDGNCHVYVDVAADLEMAERIVANAKTQRPGVCNAAETLLVHSDVAAGFLPHVLHALHDAGVTLHGDARVRELVADLPVRAATEEDWDTEYLALTLAVAVVDSLEAAIEHISAHGTGHSEAIVTRDRDAARRFQLEVDAACVYVNASTR
ncbi:MAG TPA: glutamate-5-semialdehyde dehydrogenase, partial [Acidimicrobiales bacterium]